MVDTVNVIVTCTKDKRAVVTKRCSLRSVPKGTIAERIAEWRGRLESCEDAQVIVRDLYAGDHWSIARSISSKRFNVNLWVCSAGYGLLRLADQITPYSATFASSHIDSVCRNTTDYHEGHAAMAWWRQLAKWRGPSKGQPRSLTELAALHPRCAMLVVASEIYLNAIATDLRGALQELADPNLLSIISAGSKKISGLEEHLIPCDARFQSLVNGARRSLNVRIASRILSEAKTMPSRDDLTKKYGKLLESQPEITRYDRTPLTDDEIRTFIAAQLRINGNLRHHCCDCCEKVGTLASSLDLHLCTVR
jgi:hypothetical protein